MRWWIVSGIIGIGLFLRLYRLADWFYYTFDEEVISFVGRRMVVQQHIPLIGGVTPLKFHLGPLFYYLSTLVLWISDLNPLGWGVFAAGIAAITLVLIYHVGKLFFDKKTGLVATLLAATSYFMVITDRHYWPLMPNPLYALLTLWSLYEIKRGRRAFIMLLAGTLTLAAQTDPSNFALIFLAILVWWRAKFPLHSKLVVLGASVVLLSNLLPLGLFELRHNFYNTRQFVSFFQQEHNQPSFRPMKFMQTLAIFPNTFSRYLAIAEDHDMSIQLTPCADFIPRRLQAIPWFLWWATLGILLWFVWRTFQRRKDLKWFGARLIAGFGILIFIGITLYSTVFGADLYEQYLSGFAPFFFLLAAFALTRLRGVLSWVAMFIVVNLVIANVSFLFQGGNRFGWKDKMNAVEYVIAETGDRPFSVHAIGSCYAYGGYRYLFTLAGKEPVESYVDGDLGWLYDEKPFVASKKTPVHLEKVQRVVIAAPNPSESTVYQSLYDGFTASKKKSQSFGNIEVILLQ